ncbi:MAG: exo-alpha-sialidase [Planctomycetota bacterium]
MNASTEPSVRTERQVRWVGPLDTASPTLGLPVLDNLRKVTLYRAADHPDHFSHHAYLAVCEGVLFAMWSTHLRDEDGSGQRVSVSRSHDNGRTWTPAETLFPPLDEVRVRAEQDDWKDLVLLANGSALVDGTLYAVAEAHVLGSGAELSPPDGIPRSEDAVRHTFESRPGVGRLARAISTDGTMGPIFWLVDDPPPAVEGFPTYPGAANPAHAATARAVNEVLAQPEHWPSWEFVQQRTRPWARDGHKLCEPTQSWRLPDGTRARIWRDLSHGSDREYVQFESGDGPTDADGWQLPERCDFPDAYSRSATGNLPDGTAYLINNPGKGRDPLVLSLARDGLTFDRHAVLCCGAPPVQFEGVAKGPGFQYPHALVHDGMLHVLYSIGKEDMELTGIPLERLQDELCVTPSPLIRSPRHERPRR